MIYYVIITRQGYWPESQSNVLYQKILNSFPTKEDAELSLFRYRSAYPDAWVATVQECEEGGNE